MQILKGIFRSKFNPWSNTPWHRVRPPLERSSLQTASLRSFSNLRNDRTITIHCSIRLQQETAIKKPQIMLRTAPNFSNSSNRVYAHRSRHQTSASFAGLLLYSEHNSPLSCCSFLLWEKPCLSNRNNHIHPLYTYIYIIHTHINVYILNYIMLITYMTW